MTIPDIKNRNVLVMGLGRFGGGIGVARWLCGQGAQVTVTDLAGRAALADSVRQLSDCDVTFHLGGHDTRDLESADLVVVGPAVDQRRSEFFGEIVARGIPWTTEINLFLSRCRGRVVGVTGTAGKSTTCAMLHHILDGSRPAGRRVWFGGNVGRSLLGDLPDIQLDDVVILELSSFHLENVPQIGTSPPIAVITNVWPNHLDRHGDFDSYLSAKLNLFRSQQPGDRAVVGGGDAALLQAVGRITARTQAKLITVREPIEAYELRIPGRHNQHNAACASAVAGLLDVDEGVCRGRLMGFAGLPHRLEYVGTINDGVDCYNDSKSTTPRGTATALGVFECPVVVLIGGQERGDDCGPLVEAVIWRAKAAVCLGAGARLLADAIRAARGDRSEPAVEACRDLPDAVQAARRLAHPGGVILLSPGAPSYGDFVNYEHRGQAFADLIQPHTSRQ